MKRRWNVGWGVVLLRTVWTKFWDNCPVFISVLGKGETGKELRNLGAGTCVRGQECETDQSDLE